MAGETTTPPAGGIDVNALGAAIGAAIAKANEPLLQAIKGQQPAAQPAAGQQQAAAATTTAAAADKPLTAAGVARLLDERDTRQQAASKVSAARDRFVGEKMKDLPALYQQQLPSTDNPTELAQAEQRIRQQYQADFKAAGGTTQNVGGTTVAGATTAKPGDVVDLSKAKPMQLLEAGLKDARPAAGAPVLAGSAGQPAPAGAATTTTTTTAAAK